MERDNNSVTGVTLDTDTVAAPHVAVMAIADMGTAVAAECSL